MDRGRPEGERQGSRYTVRSRSRLTYSLADLILPRVLVALAPTPLSVPTNSVRRRFWIRKGRVSRAGIIPRFSRAREDHVSSQNGSIVTNFTNLGCCCRRLPPWHVEWDLTTTTKERDLKVTSLHVSVHVQLTGRGRTEEDGKHSTFFFFFALHLSPCGACLRLFNARRIHSDIVFCSPLTSWPLLFSCWYETYYPHSVLCWYEASTLRFLFPWAGLSGCCRDGPIYSHPATRHLRGKPLHCRVSPRMAPRCADEPSFEEPCDAVVVVGDGVVVLL